MREDAFRTWLSNSRRNGNSALLDARTVNSRLSNCKTVERYEGNLDDHFDKDQLSGLIERLMYSTEDERGNRPARHRIPINGNVRNVTATLKTAARLYREFCQSWVEGTPISRPTLNRTSAPAIPRSPKPLNGRVWLS